MNLENVRLYNFRCYPQIEFKVDSKFNVFQGANGQGKTSILESIGLLSGLKSFRGAKTSEVIHKGQTISKLSGEVSHQTSKFNLEVHLEGNRKQITLNGNKCRYFKDYLGKFSTVSFNPSDLEIIKGAPEERRSWIDKFAQIYFSDHFDLLIQYKKVLDQRNKYLRDLSDNPSLSVGDDFEIWNEKFVELGSQVIHRRVHTVDKSVDIISEYYSKIAGQKTVITTEYLSSFLSYFGQKPARQTPLLSVEIISQTFKAVLSEIFLRERIVGQTLAGPHRDDLDFFINTDRVKSFGSQGEVRSLVLSMRLAESESYKNVLKLDPVLLIDDFSSELDADRRSFLLSYLKNTDSQVFLTTTEKLNLGKLFIVHQNNILSEHAPRGAAHEFGEQTHRE